MPKVSVIIPVYNGMAYLPKTLESVLKQTFTDFEVLIVNDGSSDHLVDWASELSDSRVKLISQSNQGVSVARNTGIANAQGDYLAFLDQDDLWDSTLLEKEVRCLNENPGVGLVHTWMLLIDENDQSTGRVMVSNTEGFAREELLRRNTIGLSSVMARRYCFDRVGGFDPSLRSLADWEMWIRISAVYQLAVIKEPITYYRKLSNSLSKDFKLMEKDFYTVIEKTFQSLPSELQYLKRESYGFAYLCLGWQASQSASKDHRLVSDYRRQAVSYYPQLRLSVDYIRLSLAALLMQLFGNNYDSFLKQLYVLRRSLAIVISKA